MILKICFWIPAFLILHTYVVYPLLLIMLNKLFKTRGSQTERAYLPGVSVLMAVHNEKEVIEAKIKALIDSDYPSDKYDIIVGSDASDDGTDEILSELKRSFPKLRVLAYNERIGKPAVINRLSGEAHGEILIITDANVMPGKETVKKLVSNFSDKMVGLADSRLLNTGIKRDGISFPEVAYISFESKLKSIEGRLWGTMMGPFGGFYAVRKESFRPVEGNTLADDFRICMNVISAGERAISDPEAVVHEDISNNLKDEFIRKVRISAGNFQNLKHFAYLFLKPFSMFSFCFISHKALRWLVPFLWFIVVFTNILLLKGSLFYQLLFLLQVIFIILPPLDIILKKVKINLVPLRFFTHLFFMNVALFVGFVRYFQGIRSGIWTPTKRYQ